MSITTPLEQPSAGACGRDAWTPADLLAAAARADHRVRLAEAEKLSLSALWADANPVTEQNPLPARLQLRGDDIPAHPGLADVTASAVAELAARFAVTTHACTSLVADALELRARLPRVWDLTMTGQFQVWRARQLAQATARLNDAATDWIDRHAAIAGLGLGPRQLDDLVLRATALYDADQLAAQDTACFVRIGSDRHNTLGMANLDGRLSGLDAADLDAALQAEAALLGRAGDPASLDQRRATALGNLARAALGQATLPAGADRDVDPVDDAEPAPVPAHDVRPTGARPARRLTLYAHLSAASLGIGAGCDHCAGTTLASVPPLGALVTPDVIRDWCGNRDLQVTITPVIDTTVNLHSRADTPPSAMQAQVAIRDRVCVFPYCSRPAHPQPRRAGQADRPDLDHIDPRCAGGLTASTNIATLCRPHHRLKTFTRWRYRQLSTDGIHLWTSPTGVRYLTTPTTTVNLSDSGDDRTAGRSPDPEPVSREHRAMVERARNRIKDRGYPDASRSDPADDPPDPDPPPF